MRRAVFILPGLIQPDQRSPLRERLPNLERLAESGLVGRLAPMPQVETPEALFLGLEPSEGQMRQGPLTVSALGADPPERSMHFHVSIGSFDGERVHFPEVSPSETWLQREMPRLNTKSMTILPGEASENGLVWEGLGDLGTTDPFSAEGSRMSSCQPEGDNEKALRRLIDDSVNLLSELEPNRIRLEEGLPMLNILWPWGHGVRRPVPNLMLRRGERATVESASLRLAGLTRLAGYAHTERTAFGPAIEPRFEAIGRRLREREISLIVFDSSAYPAGEERSEWFVHQLDCQLLEPLVKAAALEPTRIAILAPGTGAGISLVSESPFTAANSLPFDERILDDQKAPIAHLHELVDSALVLR